ncbi:putative holin-like toxin [Anaerosacchariphilus polymeriproducens]|nr:putative holin-like toxin [Anaerosacchariphilus polymeriproducens]
MQYVTYDNLIQFGLFIIALIGLVHKISHKDKK